MKEYQLSYHQVSTDSLATEYVHYKMFEPWVPKNPRHRLVHAMKCLPDHSYKGGWGPELVLWRPGSPARVWATEARAQEIAQWIEEHLLPAAIPE